MNRNTNTNRNTNRNTNNSVSSSLLSLLFVFVLLLSVVQHGTCFVSTANSSSSGNQKKPQPQSQSKSPDIRIVGLPGGGVQSLPAQYMQSFPRWNLVLEEEEETAAEEQQQQQHQSNNNDNNNYNNNDCSSSSSSSSFNHKNNIKMTLKGLSGSGATSSTTTSGGSGFVDPTSTTELWWPLDLAQLQIRPTLDILIQNGGIPKYVAGGLQVRVPPQASANGKEWYNYGLHSQPLARQWTTFEFAVEPNFRIMEPYVGRPKKKSSSSRKENQQEQQDDDDDEEWEYVPLSSIQKTTEKSIPIGTTTTTTTTTTATAQQHEIMKQAIETVGVYLSSLEDDSPLSEGFHILSIALSSSSSSSSSSSWMDLPKLEPNHNNDNNNNDNKLKLIHFATAEPAPPLPQQPQQQQPQQQQQQWFLQTLMDERWIGMTASSIMEVTVEPTAPGSESEFLPDVYRPLYVRAPPPQQEE